MSSVKVQVKCSRCHGQGFLNWTRNAAGRCFLCNGAGFNMVSQAVLDKRAAAELQRKQDAAKASIASSCRLISAAVNGMHLLGPKHSAKATACIEAGEVVDMYSFQLLDHLDAFLKGERQHLAGYLAK